MSGPTLLLLHAFPLDSRMWDAQRDALTQAGYHVLAPDLPGPDGENTLGAWAERVLGLTEGPLVPVGVSMGGYLAFELWRRRRDRIAALALLDTRAEADTPESRAARDESIRVVCEEGVTELWEGLEGKLFSPATPPDTVARAREIALEQGPSRLRAALEAIRERPDSRPDLAAIDVPVLVIVGEDDAVTPPPAAEALAAAIPSAQLLRIPAAGHLSPLEAPERVNEALAKFLAGVARDA